MGVNDLHNEKLKENFAEISNSVFEHIGTQENSLTKIENYDEEDGFVICLPPYQEFFYSNDEEKEFKKDKRELERYFGISLI